MSSRYTKQTNPDGSTSFTVYPSKVWRPNLLIWLLSLGAAAVGIAMLLIAIAVLGRFGLILAAGFLLILGYLQVRETLYRRSQRIRTTSLTVSLDTIRLPGQTVLVSDIATIDVGHSFPVTVSDSRPGVSGEIAWQGAAAKSIAGYNVRAIINGEARVLAGGLEEHTAVALQQEIARHIGFTSQRQ